MRTIVIPLLALLAAAPTAAAAVQEHAIYLHEYSGGLHIVPEVIHAEVGDTLRVTVHNQGASPHNLRFCGDPAGPMESCRDVWAFTGMIPPNGTAPMTVDVKKAGTFDYYCYIAGHKGGGMAGQLIVEGGAEEKSAPAAPLAALLAALVAVAFLRRR